MRVRLAIVACVAVCVALFGAGSALAQVELRLSTSVRPTRPNTSAPFQLIVSVEGTRVPQVRPPQLPRIDGLRIVSGPQSSQLNRFVNGQVSASMTYTWTVLAAKAGRYEIPPLDLMIGGQPQRTERLAFTVDRGAGGSETSGRVANPVILRAKASRTDVYVGEPIAFDVTVFTRERITSYDWAAVPRFDDFWSERIEVDPDGERYETKIGGETFAAYPLDRQTLVPQRAGTFTIEPYVAEFRVRAPARRSFELFDFGRSRSLQRNTAAIDVNVKQLPLDGKPQDFTGAVGSFAVNAEFDRQDAEVNDAVALRVTVEGDGTLLSVSPPALSLPRDLEVFDPQVKANSFRRRGNGFSSRKTWEWIVIPTNPGEFVLPEIAFRYFDPGSETYRVAAAEPLTLAVNRGDSQPDRAVAARTLAPRRQLHFVKPLEGELITVGRRIHRTPQFAAAVAAPLLLAPALIWGGRHRARLTRDQGRLRGRKARNRARKKLTAARQRLSQISAAEFHEEVARALVEYVADRFDRSGAGLTYDVVDELLRQRGIDPDICRRYRAVLEQCDFARFVPSSGETSRQNELIDDALALVDVLEGVLK